MTQDQLKQAVAQAAMDLIRPQLDQKSVIGVGTGSTANFFIDALAQHKMDFDGAVASSDATAARLKAHGIPVYDLNSTSDLEFYVDGADESDEHLNLIKGGGGALLSHEEHMLTRERLDAAMDADAAVAEVVRLLDPRPTAEGQYPIPVAPGTYLVSIQRTYTPWGELRVRD